MSQRSGTLLTSMLFLAMATQSWADSFSINLINRSGQQVVSVTATPTGAPESSAQNLLSAAIPADEDAEATITFEAPPETCLFDLVITADSGKVTSRPETDVCQLEAMIIE